MPAPPFQTCYESFATAPFACAIDESAAALTSREASPPLYVRMSSDAYSDSRGGGIFGICHGQWWLFVLD
eukprot:1000114-Pleurochrysis_carterae.AAC.1